MGKNNNKNNTKKNNTPGELTPGSPSPEKEKPAEEYLEAEVLEPLDVGLPTEHRQKANSPFTEDEKWEIYRDILERGKHVAVVCKERGVSKSTILKYLAELKDEKLVHDEFEDIALSDMLLEMQKEIARTNLKPKLQKAGIRDIAIAMGILIDKRRDLRGPKRGGANTRLRIAWKGGEGAVELETEGN